MILGSLLLRQSAKFVNRSVLIRRASHMSRQLFFSDGPMVWIDCEMTGLNPQVDKIMEIAVIITDGNLEPVDDGIEFIIRTPKDTLDGMDSWCTKHHGNSGLTEACLKSLYSHEFVYRSVLGYIKKYIPEERVAVLAGNSVHADRVFLDKYMPDIVNWLHYRIIDVSTVKELSRRWYSREHVFNKASNHRALDDIRGSIQELKFYRNDIFRPRSPSPSSKNSTKSKR